MLGELLMDYQKAWISDNSPIKVCAKSRRIGLTWAEAGIDVLEAAKHTTVKTDILYISTREELAKEFIDTAAEWAVALNIGFAAVGEDIFEDPDGDIKAYRIDFLSGNSIIALSSKPSNLRGMQGIVVIDEAAYHQDLAAMIKAALALLMWGGKVRIISTHCGTENEFNQIIEKIKRGDLNWSYHEIPLDKALEDGLYKRICEVQRTEWSAEAEAAWKEELVKSYGDGALEELFCQPQASGTQYFSRELLLKNMVDDFQVLRLTLKPEFVKQEKWVQKQDIDIWLREVVKPILEPLQFLNYRSYCGLDFGRSHDLTVLSIILEDYTTSRRWVPLIIELRLVPFEMQRLIVDYVLSRLKKFRGGSFDATGNGAYLAESLAIDYGAGRIKEIKMSNDFYLDAFPKYKAALENGKLSLPWDEEIIKDHLLIQLVNGVPKAPAVQRTQDKEKKPRHGDAAISLMLAWSQIKEDYEQQRQQPPAWSRPMVYN